MINEDMPWLPADAGSDFDPIEHADIEIDADTPMVVTPRGGAREVGRSCYQLDTRFGTYLIDCGLNQGSGGQFPDFRGLEPGDVDGVFLTHAHIDHCGGLPVLENKGLLSDDAPIVMTRPTAQLAQTLLEDSLKIHRREAQRPGREQRFTERDVEEVYERFTTIDYGDGGQVEEYADVPEREPLTFEYGNTSHLLGSAWISFQSDGYRAVFSGDIGNRSSHLPDMDAPPRADFLLLESTYGSLHSHKSYSSAQTELYNAIQRAVKSNEPVLIPTFAVGRAQLIMLTLSDRLHSLPDHLRSKVRVVLDGMAQETTDQYHTYVRNETYFSDSIVNRAENSGITQPFLPEGTVRPDSDEDRKRILDEFDPESGENVPIIVAPSGMLTGGHSPRYLTEFASRYESARVVLTGYQAKGTMGRAFQNAKKAGEKIVAVETDARPFGTDWSDSYTTAWVTDEETGERVTRVTVPVEWVETVNGLSAHASQMGLLDVARDVGAETIGLVHGPAHAQERLAQHLTENAAGVEQVTRPRMLTPIEITRDVELETPTLVPEKKEDDFQSLDDQLEFLRESVAALGEEVAAERNDSGFSEGEIRELIREEVEKCGVDSGD